MVPSHRLTLPDWMPGQKPRTGFMKVSWNLHFRRKAQRREGVTPTSPLIAGFVLVGYIALMLLAAFCMTGVSSADHHHHGPLHHQHTPLCGWAHSVGAAFLVLFGVSLVVFLCKKRNPLRVDTVSPRLMIGLPLFGRAPPLLSA